MSDVGWIHDGRAFAQGPHFNSLMLSMRSLQAEKVWDSVLKKHELQSAETELNKTLRCDVVCWCPGTS